MYTIIDYLNYYKRIPLKDVHWNIMDNLLCAILAYVPAETYYGAKRFQDFCEYAMEYQENEDESAMASMVYEIVEAVQGASRYQDMLVCNFQNRKDNDSQFGAVTFHIEGTTVVGYKGTDYSLIGWFENFRLAYEYPTQTHRLAMEYLRDNANAFRDGDVYVCGHSKGGNLALVAAMEMPDEVFRRIRQVCNFDGPGLRKEEFARPKFRRLSGKLVNVVPSGSIVGVLMNNTEYQVVRSNRRAVSEHYPTSWNVFGECFIGEKLSKVSERLHESTTKGIENLDYAKTEEALEFIFRSFGREYSSNLSLSLDTITTFYENIKVMDPEMRKSLDSILESMLITGFDLPVGKKLLAEGKALAGGKGAVSGKDPAVGKKLFAEGKALVVGMGAAAGGKGPATGKESASGKDPASGKKAAGGMRSVTGKKAVDEALSAKRRKLAGRKIPEKWKKLTDRGLHAKRKLLGDRKMMKNWKMIAKKTETENERKGKLSVVREELGMSVDKVKKYFDRFGMGERVMEFDVSSATVELAAEALHCEPGRIAKTLSFLVGERPILIVTAGDAKIDNHRYKEKFGKKAKMLTPDEAVALIGHAVGGVCPFAVEEGVEVYLDESLKRFETVFPACGSSNSAIELTIPELEQYSGFREWIDVCKDWSEKE